MSEMTLAATRRTTNAKVSDQKMLADDEHTRFEGHINVEIAIDVLPHDLTDLFFDREEVDVSLLVASQQNTCHRGLVERRSACFLLVSRAAQPQVPHRCIYLCRWQICQTMLTPPTDAWPRRPARVPCGSCILVTWLLVSVATSRFGTRNRAAPRSDPDLRTLPRHIFMCYTCELGVV